MSTRTQERQRAEEALRRESALVRLLEEAATIANEGGTSSEVFRSVLELICRSTGWAVGHVWLVSKQTDGVTLESAQAWYTDEPHRRRLFRQATATLRLAPGEGLPGQVLATGRPTWAAALSEPQDPRCQSLEAAGLKTGCAIPVEAAGQMAAVMEFFSAEIREQDRVFLETIAIAGTQIGRVLEREQRNREAALLDELAELLQTSMTTTEAYAVFERFGPQCFPEAAGTLFIVSPSRDVLEQVSAWGESDGRAATMTPDDCWALRRGHAHFSERAAGVVCPHLGDAPGISLCVPIAAQNESLGLLHLKWTAQSGRNDVHDGVWAARERLAVTLASQIGPAITNLRLRDTLRAQSIRDPLTGLFNRRYMEESLEREIHRSLRRSAGMAVVMLDIDFFKLFNDTYGHEAGDAVLSAFGALLLANSRKEDIACRYGGEEFTLILSEATHKEALDRAEQLRTVAADLHVRHRGEALGSITISVGVAVFPTHGTNGKALLRAADSALYRAKQNGRARVEVAV
ncbi:MAG TPA: sensor domain-containing diguanylate cyclase [bacterium]|nr:sensor domain-containing diguanylate cyclase [bacterium]